MSHIDPMTAVHGGGPKSPSRMGMTAPGSNSWSQTLQTVEEKAQLVSEGAKAGAAAQRSMDMKWLAIAGAAIAAWYFLAQ